MVDTAHPSEILCLIPALPLAAAIFHGVMLGLVRRESPRSLVAVVSCGALVGAFVLSVVALFELLGTPAGSRLLVDDLYTWVGSGSLNAQMALHLDPLSAFMILIVTGVGTLIHVYSVGYMEDDKRDDKGFQRFFCYLNLFTFAMLILVLGDNLVLMFLGWEGVGLCSYLLIGFWYSDRHNAYCGSKAFIVNRIGDFGFLVGIFLLFWAMSDAGVPTVTFRDLAANFGAIADENFRWALWPGAAPMEWKLASVIGLCFFLGACGKSAQIPLYVWLPDAMAGPTPVSALIHAATMVTAGIYMVCRLSFVYDAGPGAASVVAWTGALTAFFAAILATAQTDIKKVLAYSTISQLGYMFLAAGCGAYTAAIFHLGTHAFFKALLFLAAGAVILAMHHEQNMDRMGGLQNRIRITAVLFGIGVLAIIGFPGMSGFFSKDEVLLSAWVAHDVPGHRFLWALALVTAGLTAFYMFRMFFRVFFGECRAPVALQAQIEEPADTVLVPLYVLALLSVFGGIIGLPQVWGDLLFSLEDSNSLALFLSSVVHEKPHAVATSTELWLALCAVLAAATGTAAAWLLYLKRPGLPRRLRERLRGLHQLVVRTFYVDEAIDALLIRPLVAISDRVLYRGIDAGLIDGVAVGGAAVSVRTLAAGVLRRLQTGLAQGYLFAMVIGTLVMLGLLLR